MDEIQRIIFQFEGRQKLEELTAMLGKESAVLETVVAQHKAAGNATAAHSQQAQQSANVIRGYVQQIDALDRRLKAAASATGPGAASAGMKMQGIQQLGYAVQDFVSTSGGLAQKFNSVTNNIQGLASAFVPSAWGFVAITGFTSAVQLLFNNAGAIADWFNGVDTAKLEAQAKKVKELEAKSKTLESSLEKIRRAEGRTQWTEESGAVASEAIKGAGGVDKVRARLADQYASESAVMGGAQASLDAAAPEADAANAALAATPKADWQAMDRARKRADAANKALSDAQARVAKARADAEARAGETLVGATEGDAKSVYELAKRFGGDFNQATIDGIRAADKEAAASMAETETTPADRKFRNDRRKDRERAEARRGRLASNELDDEQNARGTAAEERLSAAITYLEQNLGRLAPGLKLTNEEIVKAGEALVRLRDVDEVGPMEAPAAAVRPFVEARRGVRRDVQLDEIRDRLDVDTGGRLNEDQLNGVARETQNLMRQGVAPMAAAQQAINELLQSNAALMGQMQAMSQGFASQAQQARFQAQQVRAMGRRFQGGPATGGAMITPFAY
ncbi:MAG: hypothetical protein BGO49_07145 [Planctomycetales bacterium 71-10]|nr:MAG: hypothetical protein BGO49_07145 [Planctomycetales bacterium 71-10]